MESRFRDQMIRSGRLSRITRTGFTLANRSRVDHRGSIEALSTMNDAKGVMARFIAQGIRMRRRGRRREKRRKREKKKNFLLFHWCVWDVIERCQDSCITCNLHRECDGKAHYSEGSSPSQMCVSYANVCLYQHGNMRCCVIPERQRRHRAL